MFYDHESTLKELSKRGFSFLHEDPYPLPSTRIALLEQGQYTHRIVFRHRFVDGAFETAMTLDWTVLHGTNVLARFEPKAMCALGEVIEEPAVVAMLAQIDRFCAQYAVEPRVCVRIEGYASTHAEAFAEELSLLLEKHDLRSLGDALHFVREA